MSDPCKTTSKQELDSSSSVYALHGTVVLCDVYFLQRCARFALNPLIAFRLKFMIIPLLIFRYIPNCASSLMVERCKSACLSDLLISQFVRRNFT
jgi:hypothetical protein